MATSIPEVDRVAAARRAVSANPHWYHTLELAPGVTTPGRIDLRNTAAKVLPSNLDGKRALDIGAFDGFWAFELEKRGAEVVAIDIDRPSEAQLPSPSRPKLEAAAREMNLQIGNGFRLAAGLLGSRARRVPLNVLELSPDAIGGPVDVAFMGALLLHLRDPVQALERILQTLTPGGELYQLEGVSLRLSLLHPRRPVAHMQAADTDFNWWYPNAATLNAWLVTAGFNQIRGLGFHRPAQQRPMANWYRGLASRRPR